MSVGWPSDAAHGGLLPVFKIGGSNWCYGKIYRHDACPDASSNCGQWGAGHAAGSHKGPRSNKLGTNHRRTEGHTEGHNVRPNADGFRVGGGGGHTTFSTLDANFLASLPPAVAAKFPGVRAKHQIVSKELVFLLDKHAACGTADDFVQMVQDLRAQERPEKSEQFSAAAFLSGGAARAPVQSHKRARPNPSPLYQPEAINQPEARDDRDLVTAAREPVAPREPAKSHKKKEPKPSPLSQPGARDNQEPVRSQLGARTVGGAGGSISGNGGSGVGGNSQQRQRPGVGILGQGFGGGARTGANEEPIQSQPVAEGGAKREPVKGQHAARANHVQMASWTTVSLDVNARLTQGLNARLHAEAAIDERTNTTRKDTPDAPDTTISRAANEVNLKPSQCWLDLTT